MANANFESDWRHFARLGSIEWTSLRGACVPFLRACIAEVVGLPNYEQICGLCGFFR